MGRQASPCWQRRKRSGLRPGRQGNSWRPASLESGRLELQPSVAVWLVLSKLEPLFGSQREIKRRACGFKMTLKEPQGPPKNNKTQQPHKRQGDPGAGMESELQALPLTLAKVGPSGLTPLFIQWRMVPFKAQGTEEKNRLEGGPQPGAAPQAGRSPRPAGRRGGRAGSPSVAASNRRLATTGRGP